MSAVRTPLDALMEAAGPGLAQALASAERRLEAVAEGHGAELGAHARSTLEAGGKRLRPTLVFVCAGEADSEDLLRAAVAVELLHMATLVHDDVLDRAALRRGRPTVFASAGRPAATATGDMLFSCAFAELALTRSAEAVRVLSDASSALARGELMQRADAWSPDVTTDRYLERCDLKTGRLFDAACRLGAELGAPGPRSAPALGAFGSRVGLAFQILDDILDVAGPAARTGKPRGTDLLDGTVTLPLILARRRDPDLVALDLREAGPERAAEACDRIAATGALEEARELALGYVADAKRSLAEVRLDARQLEALDLVADGVVDRYA